jgi:hypothetical protein
VHSASGKSEPAQADVLRDSTRSTVDAKAVRNFSFDKAIENLCSIHSGKDAEASVYRWALDLWRNIPQEFVLVMDKIIAPRIEKQFTLNGAESDLKELEELGVRHEVLFIALLLFLFLPRLDNAAQTTLGDLKERQQKAKLLLKAAVVMDEIAGDPDKLDFSMMEKAASVPVPIKVADALHFYAKFLFGREQLMRALSVNSGLEVAKYTIAGVVHRITGKYLDRLVSGVVGVCLRIPEYDETAHRVWRIRTYPRLNRTISFLPIILHALNTVLLEKTDPEECTNS